MKKTFLILFSIILAFNFTFGEFVRITLKDGKTIEGKVVKYNNTTVEIEEDGIKYLIPKSQIADVTKTEPKEKQIEKPKEINRELIKKAGEKLQLYTTLYYAGFGAQVIGLVCAEIAINTRDTETAIFGLLIAVAGAIVQLVSHYYIYDAGNYLKQVE